MSYLFIIIGMLLFLIHFTVTFIEVLPKEKKQKEEKTVVLGQCSVDMLPMLEGSL